jgi:hypothetical protein
LKLSQFHELINDEFGAGFSGVIASDTRLTELRDATPNELLSQGEDPREVWLAICRHLDVPKERWQGKLVTKRHAE